MTQGKMGIRLGRIERLDVRDAWPDEARDLTPWLAENLDLLAEAVGLDLEPEGTELSVGSFSADIVATEQGTGRRIVIENQLEPTDHTHLGQLLTYAAGVDAAALVWLSSSHRDEHLAAVDWINRHTGSDIGVFAVELELVRIGSSEMAPSLRLVSGPNEWAKIVDGGQRGDRSRRYLEFNRQLLDDFLCRNPGATRARPTGDNWAFLPTGRSGTNFYWSFTRDGFFNVSLALNGSDKEQNKARYDALLARRTELEDRLKIELHWDRMDDRKMSWIAARESGSIDMATDDLARLRTLGVDRLERFREVFGEVLGEIE